MKQNILNLHIFLLLLFCSCAQNTSIDYEVPQLLKENKDATALINEMAKAVSIAQQGMQNAAEFATEQVNTNSDSLSIKQLVKISKFTFKIHQAKTRMDKIQTKAGLLAESLPQAQADSLLHVLSRLEARIGDINPEDFGFSEDELKRFKTDAPLSSRTDELESIPQNNMDTIDAESAEFMEQYINNNEYLSKSELNDEPKIEDKNEPSIWIGIACLVGLILIIIVFMIFMGLKLIKRIRNAADRIN